MLGRVLKLSEHKHTPVLSGKAALKALKNHNFRTAEDADTNASSLLPYDTVITDIQMPLMDGYELALAIQELQQQHRGASPPLVVIACTAAVSQEVVEKCRECGIDTVITKV